MGELPVFKDIIKIFQIDDPLQFTKNLQ